jgi:predicted anti-sigma-YlaC factor YlaD
MDREILKNILRILTLTCDQAAQLMSHAQDIQLNRLERWALSVHLLICSFCRKYNRQLKLLRSVLSRMADSRTYDDVVPPLLDPEQSKAFQDRLSKKIQENLDSM